MSHPGSGPENQFGQQPGQPGQPFEQGQPGQPYQPLGQQPGQPAGAWTPPGGATPAGEPAKKPSAAKKILPAVGAVAIAGVLFAGNNSDWFGLTGIKVDDCVTGGTEIEEVDCDSDDAEAKVVGIEDEEMSFDDAQQSEETCLDFETADSFLWEGAEDDSTSEPGKIYCVETLP
ncbi:hypothetical protein DQ237_03245 [Blastococcus sp. TF02-8]|uniref:hypothetical protein n=1 Tax=Blastococcus sp. TF02-8 TaxID=2250574 RepID=UPI000DE9B09B|nr:hypothetical protein [Blastococcus sp. TF02-8]RBY97924.1 hypothetical protein DQ237_03245 [Blastococcus sp. TF02-8]